MTILDVDGRPVEITHPDRVLFPADGITKLDIATYYRDVAEVMVPHLTSRPLTMERFPEDIREGGFFQKEASEHFPDWISRAVAPKEGGSVRHAVADSARALVYLANQGVLTFHTTLSHADEPRLPDRVIFDLDPSNGSLSGMRTAVRAVRNLGRRLGLEPFLMTTGSRGFHVLFPIQQGPTFDDTRAFAHAFAARLASEHPNDLTIEVRKADRGGRVFVDYLRNGYAQTAVAPYSVRARDGAPVAAPIGWIEYGRGTITPQSYTIANIRRRLAQKRDPWRDLDTFAVSLKVADGQLAAMAPP